MLCDNCGKREANVRYSENINGKVRELNLCEECSQKLGIGHMDFSMPMDFSNFFGDFMEEFAKPEWMPLLNEVKTLTCDNCGYTFDDIVNTGKLGCGNCYDVFEAKLDPIIKRIQGANQHVGRIGKIIDNKIDEKLKQSESKENNDSNNMNNENNNKIENANNSKDNDKKAKLEQLQEQLKLAIKEERYEDAAKIRDEIKKYNGDGPDLH